jgi:hypothetical protein
MSRKEIIMAKGPKKNAPDPKLAVLTAIANDPNGFQYVSQAEGGPLVADGLIEVNTTMLDPSDNTKAAARLTDAGRAYVGANGSAPAASEPVVEASPYAILTNAVPPISKRGNKGGGAKTQYPFDKMEVGNSFFVPVSDKHTDPAKTLASTVSAANNRYSEDTGEKKTVTRAKRGPKNKAIRDAAGEKVKETVDVAVKKQTRKFILRKIEAGKKYGDWVAPADGALISRVEVK